MALRPPAQDLVQNSLLLLLVSKGMEDYKSFLQNKIELENQRKCELKKWNFK